MSRANLNDLQAFVVIAREGSFTRAAAQLGVSQSALSHTMRTLETRLGVRLLTRTTRSVSPTDAGQRLYQTMAPRFEEIERELSAVTELSDTPAGSVRISASEHAANNILWPKLLKVLPQYPEVKVEITVDYALTDIVAQRYDAGVRLGDQVAKDMIAVPIGPRLHMAVVASPEYFSKHPHPVTPSDLSAHSCINLRLPTHGSLLQWDFEKDGHELKARVEGQWTFNSSLPILRAAVAGCGLAFLPEDMVAKELAEGKLVRVLQDWCQPFPGYHLYYPNRREQSSALGVVIDALRHV
ncbi:MULTISPECIES: LysR family transcriptional regulator [unclassified Pseudomonas]|uniref:LysR family transcriptional regulator n=9 Tax=Pseudomonas TaxID=286 RepID=UPI000C889A9B|nr:MULTISPECIES: LysR family transcriptional regulator [unclassified Pseudomonas]PMX42194.1 LysR family transcriptional regulator [Pseudomonas sp. MPR-R2A7]PMX53680.1 LysR family transcriptional regulator [Pseudomonas sp. MPR-R2A6]PMX90600.1 LysR family transcriptional regulator [Pseudomonas sp. MPR-R2A3]PMY15718.1 LysR family transcriptional regulator [Pseudomonas sp. MPR-R2A5]PNA35473.1 LysR family transcriptional regulator [Pseudomonas sp. MPR-ANB1]